MTDRNKMAVGAIAWLALVSSLHGALNVDWATLTNDRKPEAERKLNVAYIPVT
jgi:hypothetical protein